MKKPARAASWQDVKAILSQQSPQELLQLIRDVYALRPEVKDFIHARFLPSTVNVTPYKKTVYQSLYPDVIHGEDMDLARGRKAISDYKKATNDPVGTLELMVYYVECGTQFTVDYGDIDAGFYESLETMFTQVVKTLHNSEQETIDRFLSGLLQGLVRYGVSLHLLAILAPGAPAGLGACLREVQRRIVAQLGNQVQVVRRASETRAGPGHSRGTG